MANPPKPATPMPATKPAGGGPLVELTTATGVVCVHPGAVCSLSQTGPDTVTLCMTSGARIDVSGAVVGVLTVLWP